MKKLLCLLSLFLVGESSAADPLGWPEIRREHRPWTRWWWPGSAVDAPNLTRQLEEFRRVGLGGVEITPIYGVVGAEKRYVSFLSADWMRLLGHTGREARRLDLGVDMATGTGWPFGGPWVSEPDALQKFVLQDGKPTGELTRMQVKRAAPGGEGLVLDPYSPVAMRHYLQPFTTAFAAFPAGLVRAQFHDSFEYYHASWSPGLLEAFRSLHGYDLAPHAATLLDPAPPNPAEIDRVARLKADYRATLARLHLAYLQEWVGWSHARGCLARNQSHGAPANLLDLYGAVDIPETETFGSTPFAVRGLRRDPADLREDIPESLVIQLASSAAHVAGRPLASSETCTWLREHWKVALAFAKPEIDRLFTEGINHVLYHGTVYSPADAPWPGWLFYASTQFNPANSWWEDFAALNAYVTRVQSVLQSGRPDHDVLVYWPFADLLHEPTGLMLQFSVHDVKWLRDTPTGELARQLRAAGIAYDFISDDQLAATKGEPDLRAGLEETLARKNLSGGQVPPLPDRTATGSFVTPGGTRYRAIVVPPTQHLPLATLEKLRELSAHGPVIFAARPADVPGLADLEPRRARFQELLAASPALEIEPQVARALAARGIATESAAALGLSWIRRATNDGTDYFLANLTGEPIAGWVKLGRPARTAALLDPLDGRTGRAALRQDARGGTEVYLQLASGASLVLRTATAELAPPAPVWPYAEPAGGAVPLTGKWTIEFLRGGPALPPPLATATLRSWTELGGESAQRFAGTARYRLAFDAPATRAEDWLLDLGDVRESARVRLNGVDLGVVWALPFQVRAGAALRPGRNVLELDVTNLAANRIRDLDRRGVKWKVMREINFVNIRYQPFDASRWELTPSGLLGPVTLTPLRAPSEIPPPLHESK